MYKSRLIINVELKTELDYILFTRKESRRNLCGSHAIFVDFQLSLASEGLLNSRVFQNKRYMVKLPAGKHFSLRDIQMGIGGYRYMNTDKI